MPGTSTPDTDINMATARFESNDY
eukprot:SAG11_NODE_3175_length_2633_cov_2.028414_1_plen_23_part_10